MYGSTSSRRAMLGALCAALMGLSGCGGGGSDGGGTGSEAGFDVALVMRAPTGAERSSFDFGENIVFELTITNRSGGAQTLTLPTNQIFDFAVLSTGNQPPRWRWSFNRTFTPTVTSLTFSSHQAITYPYIWNGVLEDGTQITAGTYEVRGTLAYAQYANDWRANDELATPIKTITVRN